MWTPNCGMVTVIVDLRFAYLIIWIFLYLISKSLLIFNISIHLISKTLYWCFDNLVLERVDKLMSTLKKGSMLWPGKLDHEHHYLFHHLLSISSSTNSIHCNLVIIVHVATIMNKNGKQIFMNWLSPSSFFI